MDNPASLSDEQLLQSIHDCREDRVRLEAEIEKRFEERGIKEIQSDTWIAKQRQDTEKYVFTKSQLYDFAIEASPGEDSFWKQDAAERRVLSRPYVSLSAKPKPEMGL